MKHTEVKTPRLAAGPLGPAPSGPDLPVAMVLGRDSGNRSLSMSLLFSNISILLLLMLSHQIQRTKPLKI